MLSGHPWNYAFLLFSEKNPNTFQQPPERVGFKSATIHAGLSWKREWTFGGMNIGFDAQMAIMLISSIADISAVIKKILLSGLLDR